MANIPILDILKSKESVWNKHFAKLDHPLTEAIKKLLYGSDFAQRRIDQLKTLIEKDNCLMDLSRNDYLNLIQAIPLHLNIDAFAQQLRFFRHAHLLRLFLRELGGLSSTEHTLSQWSWCADALIKQAFQYSYKILVERFGEPLSNDGNLSHLYALAMGKLGGEELNFSSDIDLIFVYSRAGQTNGQSS